MVKTNTEYRRENRARKKSLLLPKPPPKTGAERTRAYRQRLQALHINFLNVSMVKTNTEYIRENRAHKKSLLSPKPPPKTGAERTRAYRQRLQALHNAAQKLLSKQSLSKNFSLKNDLGVVDAHAPQPGKSTNTESILVNNFTQHSIWDEQPQGQVIVSPVDMHRENSLEIIQIHANTTRNTTLKNKKIKSGAERTREYRLRKKAKENANVIAIKKPVKVEFIAPEPMSKSPMNVSARHDFSIVNKQTLELVTCTNNESILINNLCQHSTRNEQSHGQVIVSKPDVHQENSSEIVQNSSEIIVPEPMRQIPSTNASVKHELSIDYAQFPQSNTRSNTESILVNNLTQHKSQIEESQDQEIVPQADQHQKNSFIIVQNRAAATQNKTWNDNKIRKSGAQRSREYRLRKKAMENANNAIKISSIVDFTVLKPTSLHQRISSSTSVDEQVPKLDMSPNIESILVNNFTQHYSQNEQTRGQVIVSQTDVDQEKLSKIVQNHTTTTWINEKKRKSDAERSRKYRLRKKMMANANTIAIKIPVEIEFTAPETMKIESGIDNFPNAVRSFTSNNPSIDPINGHLHIPYGT